MATGDRQQQLDDDGQSQELQSALVSGIHLPYIPGPFQPSQMMMTPSAITSSQLPGSASSHPHLVQPQLSSYHQIHQQQMLQLEQQLKVFWSEQYNEIMQISSTSDFKNHNLPLARIKKIMKADEDVRMIAAEAPVLFARACEMFILELTYRSWAQTEENKRRTLLKNDIAGAITRTDAFDFLVDIVPREEVKDEVITPMPRGGPNDALPFYYPTPQFGSLGMEGCRPDVDQAFMHGHQAQPFLPQQFWEQQQQQQQTATTQQLQHPSEGIDHDHDSGNIQP